MVFYGLQPPYEGQKSVPGRLAFFFIKLAHKPSSQIKLSLSDGHNKSFDCKLLDLLLTKLEAYRFGQNNSILSYYIFHRNSTVSVLVKIELHGKTPGVSQRYVLCRMLFCFY